MLGLVTYKTGTEMVWANDLNAIWFCALGLGAVNFGFYLLMEGDEK
ncbi:hypothetical protein PHYNN_29 [Pantoea phage Phynn]|nr:hypothetical protein PHYNN_29 [Pantoea phage Phynn]